MDKCWVWSAGTTADGYGVISHAENGKMVRHGTHRLSWEIHNGIIPEGMHVLHRCDNPPCVNPFHLFLGTQLDNIADMVAKGRHGNRYKFNQGREAEQ